MQSPLLALPPDAEDDIQPVIFQSCMRLVCRKTKQLHVGVRVGLCEMLDGCGQHPGGERKRAANTRADSTTGSPNALQPLIGMLEKFAGLLQQGFANGRDPDGMRVTFQ